VVRDAIKICEQAKYHINAITYAIITFGSLRDYDEARSSSQLVAAIHFIVRLGHWLEQGGGTASTLEYTAHF
jgi:hypothetical protein